MELVASADKAQRDGALNEQEFAKLGQTDRLFATAGFAFWDTNADGKVTQTEMIEHPNPAFVLLDHDQDCTLTDIELSAARSLQSSPESWGGPPGRGGPGGGEPHGGGSGSPGGAWPG